MAKNKENKTAELLDEPVQHKKETSTSSSSLDLDSFFDKNKTIVYALVGLIALAGIGYGGYKYLASSQDEDAKREMFIPENYWQRDSLDLALNGDKVNRGFLDIADEYNLSPSANLANYYIGDIYLKKGKYDEAIEYLKKFDGDDRFVQARAYSLIGDAYMDMKDRDLESAISYYKKASTYKPNEFLTPRYIMKLAMAYEANKDYENAAKAYSTIIDEYVKASEYSDAKKYKARVEGMAQ